MFHMILIQLHIKGQEDKFCKPAHYVDMVAYALPIVDDDVLPLIEKQ